MAAIVWAVPTVLIADDFRPSASKLLKNHPNKVGKVAQTIERLELDPFHPSLRTKLYSKNDKVWQSYIENRTPSAWRVWWVWGTAPDTIVIIQFGPHP